MDAHSPEPTPAPPPSTPPRFSGRAAVVTGAARGIGRAVATALAREGCDLVICDILEDLPDGAPYPKSTQADMDETASAVRGHGSRCVAIKADVSDSAAAAAVIEKATSEFGRFDYLVSCAAVTLEGEIKDLSPETFQTVIRHNLFGTFNVVAPALKVMTSARCGRIVTIASGAARHAEAEAAPYVASKWGVIGLSKTAALEAAKAGVTVNVILPGPVDTPMMTSETRVRETVTDKPDPTRADLAQARKESTPMGYAWVEPEDIAHAVMFLLTDEARFVSGATLSVDAADSANWP
jgi:NAD(P)-dependent dehydrogenase (short-subunit alcohol dehydrogenase family)